MSNIERKKLNIGLMILIFYSISTMISDVASVDSNNIFVFYFSKILLLTFFSFLLILNVKERIQVDYLKKGFLYLIMIYCVVGEYFCPGYHLAFIQVALSAVFIYDVSRKFNLTYIVVSGILFLIFFSIFNDGNDHPSYYLSYFFDIKVAIISVTILSFFTYNEISKQKLDKEIMTQKFLDIGKNYAEIVHELKGVVFTPKIYIDILEKKTKEDELKELRDIVLNLKEEYKILSDYVVNINSLSNTSPDVVDIDCESIMNFTFKKLFKNRLKNKEFIFDFNGNIKFNEHNFRSIIVNLLINSLDNFDQKNIINPKIKVTIKNQELVFEDNGGGFSKNALNQLKTSSYFSEKPNGSGLGLFLVKRYVSDYKGSVEFSNSEEGVKIILKFNKKEVS